MILGVFIHNRKFKMDHKRFFENFYDVNKDILKRGEFVIITDQEFNFHRIWQNLVQLFCWIHIYRNLKSNVSDENNKAAAACFLELKDCRTFEAFDEVKETFLKRYDFGENTKDAELFERYTTNLRNHASIPALRKYDIEIADRDPENADYVAPSSNAAESINAKLRRIFAGETPIDMLVVKMHYLATSMFIDFRYALYGRGSWELQKGYGNLKKGNLFDVS
jgi:transposase-like protein